MMRKLIFPAAVIAFSSTLFANESWHTNIEKAAELAAKEKKAVLVDFTGSDWCGPCMALKSNIFDSPEFKELSDKSLVLVELDFPSKKEMTAEQKKYNNEQAEKFAITGYPTVFLLDEKGKVFWKRVGGGAKEEYLNSLKKGLESKDAILAALSPSQDVTGLEKAKILAKGYAAMPNSLKAENKQIEDQIIALDPEDTLGLAKKKKQEQLNASQKNEFNKFMREKVSPLAKVNKFDEATSLVKEYLETPDLTNVTKQEIYFVLSSLYMQAVQIDDAVKAIEKGIEADPENPIVQSAKKMLEELKNNREKIEAEMKKFQKEKLAPAAPAVE